MFISMSHINLVLISIIIYQYYFDKISSSTNCCSPEMIKISKKWKQKPIFSFLHTNRISREVQKISMTYQWNQKRIWKNNTDYFFWHIFEKTPMERYVMKQILKCYFCLFWHLNLSESAFCNKTGHRSIILWISH